MNRINEKLAEPHILKKIGQLKSSGMSFTGIRNKLQEEDHLNVTIFSVKKAFELYSTRTKEIVEGDKSLKNELKEVVIDTKTQLKLVNDLMWELINKAREQGKLSVFNAVPALKEIREQIKLQNDLIKDIQGNFDYKQMNTIQLTQVIVNNLENLQKDGFIKVLNKPGEKAINLEDIQTAQKGWK